MSLALVSFAMVGMLITQKFAESATSYSISVGGNNPFTTGQIGSNLYTVNLGDNTVSVIDTNTKSLVVTIPVGSFPRDPVSVGTDLYVANSGAGTVSVIDTLTNTVSNTIAVGAGPSRTILVGTDVYTMDWNSNAISVIDTNTKTVSNTIVIGVGSKIPLLVGTKLYISNTNLGNVTVVDTVTKSVIATLSIGTGGFKLGHVGSKVYVSGLSGALSNTVTVIDTATDTVISTIPVNAQAWDSFAVGSELFVTHYNPGNVSVVDTLTDTVTNVIPVSHFVSGAFQTGSSLYALSGSTNRVTVIDTVTKSIAATVTVDGIPRSAELFGDLLYVTTAANTVNIIDTLTNTLVDIGKPFLVSAGVASNIVTVTYDEPLDAGSVPATSDFVLTVDAVPVVITGAAIVGSTVELTLASIPAVGSTVLLDYAAPIAGRVQKPNGNAADSYIDAPVTVTACNMISLGYYPWYAAVSGQEAYIASGSNGVTVLDTVSRTVQATILTPPDSVRVFATSSTVYSFDSNGYSMSVIDTNSRLVTDTIPLLGGYVTNLRLVGTNLYVYIGSWSNPYDRVIVFDTLTNTEIATVSLISAAIGDFLVGTDLYLVNGNQVQILDTVMNTITGSIPVGFARYGVSVGTQAYVLSSGSAEISVIDTATKAVVNTIPFSSNIDDRLFTTGTMLYVVSQNNDNVTVINTVTDAVVATIAVGDFPGSALIYQDKLFVMNETSQDISVIDTNTQTLTATIPVYGRPRNAVIAGTSLYTMNLIDSSISVIDTSATTFVPISCVPPVTHTLTYTAGANGTIVGTSPQTVIDNANGSAVTAVPSPGFRFTQWSDASTANPRTDLNVLSDIAVTASFVTLANPGSGGSTGCVGQECGDTLGPEISNVRITELTTSTARISWSTSEPATTAFYFGLNDGYGSGYRGNATLVLEHTVLLTGLHEGTEYHYRLEGTDTRGNRTAANDAFFRTLTEAEMFTRLAITDVEATLITDTTSVINWKTNVPLNSRVDYGTSTDYGNVATNDAAAMSHLLSLSGLMPNTLYHYRVSSGYGTSVISSTDHVLNTLVQIIPPANPLNFAAVGEEGRVRLTWKNPTEESFSYVKILARPDRYPNSPADGAIVYEGGAERAAHLDLMPQHEYFYTIFAYDRLNMRSSGAIALAKVLGDELVPEPEEPPVVTPPAPTSTPPAVVPPSSGSATASPAQKPPTTTQTIPAVTEPEVPPTVDVPPVTPPENIPSQPTEEAVTPIEVPVTQAVPPEAIPAPHDELVKTVESLRIAPTAVGVVATAAAVASLASVANLFSYLGYLFSQPLMLIGARLRKKWGVVYNSITKQGTALAVVRLIDVKTGRVLQTRITDEHGRYFFHVKPGQYRIEATKAEHVFPSAIASGLAQDDEYLDIYHGTPITVETESDLMMNIPIDPNHHDEQNRMVLFNRLKTKVQYAISAMSFGITAIALVLQPSPALLGLLLLQILTYLLFRKLVAVHKPKNWGVVSEAGTNKPVKDVVVRIFDRQYNKLLETQVTDGKGRYGFLAGKNRYFVTADKLGYVRYTSPDIDLTRVEEQTIERPITLQKVTEVK